VTRKPTVVALAAAYAFAAWFFFGELCDYFHSVPGYQCYEVEWLTALAHVFLAWIPALFLKTNSKKPSAAILWVVYFTHVVPSVLLFPYLVPLARGWDLFWPVAISCLYCLAGFVSERIELHIPKYRMRAQTFHLMLATMLCICIASIVSVFGWNFEPPSIEDVYEVRRQFKQAKESTGAVLVGYFVVIGGFLLAPLSLLIAFRGLQQAPARSAVLGALSLLLAFSIYCAGGFKSVAFAALMAPLAYAVAVRFKNHSLLLAIGIPAGTFLVYLIAHTFNVEILFNHWYRRVFMVPGMNSSYFYDYIASHGLWRLPSAPSVISAQYYGTDGSANAGLFGDGFALAGYLGVLFNSGLFVLLLVAANACARDIDRNIAFAMLLLSGYAVANSALTSVFVTYGFGLLCFLFLVGRVALREPLNETNR
jgi:hypothetical protein